MPKRKTKPRAEELPLCVTLHIQPEEMPAEPPKPSAEPPAATQEATAGQDEARETAARLDHLKKIETQAAHVAALETKFDGLHDAAAEAKKALDAAARELTDLILAGARPLPLFDTPPETNAEGVPWGEDWRPTRLANLDNPRIPPALLLKLADAGIETLKQLAARDLAEAGPNRIPGIGPVALGKITDAVDAYWKRYPHPAPTATLAEMPLLPPETTLAEPEPTPEEPKAEKPRTARPKRGGLAN